MSNKLRERLTAADPGVSVGPGSAATIFDLVRALRPQLIAATKGTGVDPDRFLRVALTELRRNPRLLNAEPASLLGGLMLAAQLGLEIGSTLGQCWLVPFRSRGKTEAVFVLGYRGIIALARRSGEIDSIEARVVHEQDRFEVQYGLVDQLEHEPALSGDPGPVVAVWALARFRGGGHTFVVLTPAEIDAYRSRSKSAREGPWETDWEAMAAKTAVRRLAAWLPLTVEAAHAAAIDEEVIHHGDVDLDDLVVQQGELMTDTPTPDKETPEQQPQEPGRDRPEWPDRDEPDHERRERERRERERRGDENDNQPPRNP